ncbi:MAG: TusE/DsrC/DsvC family sulfur relay protein [Hyphomicrobiaceae bacterium]|nr:TusE/DsrC/DsvC family sulfur relay protein [Hyphomicrobiaceae bacterium]
MAIEFNGQEIETNANGYLENHEDWSEALAHVLAAQDGITLGEEQMSIINFLRDQYFNNNQTQPNTRTIVKAMAEEWGRSVDQKEVYDLFNGDPSKIAGRIAGLPESRRKGGY